MARWQRRALAALFAVAGPGNWPVPPGRWGRHGAPGKPPPVTKPSYVELLDRADAMQMAAFASACPSERPDKDA